MKNKTIAIFERRMRDHIAGLVRQYGGTTFSAPVLAEIPDVDPAHIDELIRDWNSAPPDIFIFQTGVGTRPVRCDRFARAYGRPVATAGFSAGGRTKPRADCGTAFAQGAQRPGRQRPFHDA
jgi:hypothetical protein